MTPKKIIVACKYYIRYVDVQEIVYCQADGGYTNICLTDGKKLIRTKTLKSIIVELNSSTFLRVSQSYLVNLQYICQIDKINKYIQLSNGVQIPFTISLKELVKLIAF